MEKYLRPKLFHFTKDYNIAPISAHRGYYKGRFLIDTSSTRVKNENGDEDPFITKRSFVICAKESWKDSTVCEVLDMEERNQKRNSTFRLIDNFFVRRKSTGRRIKVEEKESEGVGGKGVRGEQLKRKVLDDLPDKEVGMSFGYFNKGNERRRRVVKRKLRVNSSISIGRGNSISVQTDICN